MFPSFHRSIGFAPLAAALWLVAPATAWATGAGDKHVAPTAKAPKRPRPAAGSGRARGLVVAPVIVPVVSAKGDVVPPWTYEAAGARRPTAFAADLGVDKHVRELHVAPGRWAFVDDSESSLPSCTHCWRAPPRIVEKPRIASYVFTELAGQAAVVRGGYGGQTLAKRFLVGGGGFGLANDYPMGPAVAGMKAERQSLGAGGFFGAFRPFPQALVQPSVGAFIGFGNVAYQLSGVMPYPTTKVFVAAPQVSIDTVASDMVRLSVGASYRVVAGSALANGLTRDVTGLSGLGAVTIGRR